MPLKRLLITGEQKAALWAYYKSTQPPCKDRELGWRNSITDLLQLQASLRCHNLAIVGLLDLKHDKRERRHRWQHTYAVIQQGQTGSCKLRRFSNNHSKISLDFSLHKILITCLLYVTKPCYNEPNWLHGRHIYSQVALYLQLPPPIQRLSTG